MTSGPGFEPAVEFCRITGFYFKFFYSPTQRNEWPLQTTAGSEQLPREAIVLFSEDR